MFLPSKKKKLLAVLNLMISISILVAITVETRTSFILPPFLATAATKYPDPDWRSCRTRIIFASYLLCGAIGVAFSYLGLYSVVMASLASSLAFALCVIINVEHPPAILATFIGVLERQKAFYLLHPVLSGVIVVEGVNYLLSKYLEPKL
ncbi:MAG: HPP family protein [Candidatus Aramenus sp.]|jgi:CBS-domain-containing membrane protein|nr:HPP family protein [Candidatus Aramenus sp.]